MNKNFTRNELKTRLTGLELRLSRNSLFVQENLSQLNSPPVVNLHVDQKLCSYITKSSYDEKVSNIIQWLRLEHHICRWCALLILEETKKHPELVTKRHLTQFKRLSSAFFDFSRIVGWLSASNEGVSMSDLNNVRLYSEEFQKLSEEFGHFVETLQKKETVQLLEHS